MIDVAALIFTSLTQGRQHGDELFQRSEKADRRELQRGRRTGIHATLHPTSRRSDQTHRHDQVRNVRRLRTLLQRRPSAVR